MNRTAFMRMGRPCGAEGRRELSLGGVSWSSRNSSSSSSSRRSRSSSSSSSSSSRSSSSSSSTSRRSSSSSSSSSRSKSRLCSMFDCMCVQAWLSEQTKTRVSGVQVVTPDGATSSKMPLLLLNKDYWRLRKWHVWCLRVTNNNINGITIVS